MSINKTVILLALLYRAKNISTKDHMPIFIIISLKLNKKHITKEITKINIKLE
jgi:hypothetical protein